MDRQLSLSEEIEAEAVCRCMRFAPPAPGQDLADFGGVGIQAFGVAYAVRGEYYVFQRNTTSWNDAPAGEGSAEASSIADVGDTAIVQFGLPRASAFKMGSRKAGN